jgi:mono/diheme cytochrome c family protein
MFKVFTIVVALLLSCGMVFAQGDDRGYLIFQAHCAVCHGPQGKGDGPSAEALIPRPRDFTDPKVQASLTKDGVMDAILNGKPGTQMAAWKGKLSVEDAHKVMRYILSLR